MGKISFFQADFLLQALIENGFTDEEKYSENIKILETITEKQKNYFWVCIYKNRTRKLYELMDGIGLQKK